MHLCPELLRERYHDGRVLPFIGAGASASVSWTDSSGIRRSGPTWSQLVDQAISLLGFDPPELARVRGTDLQILEYFKLRHGGQTAQLTNWLSRLMTPPDDALRNSPIHSAIVELEKCRLLYTTNFDDFLERAFALHGKDAQASAIEMHMGGARTGSEIIKFHGDLNHPNQIVLTESDYEKRLALSTPMDFRLRSDLLGRVILFIGYSFRDPNVSYLFRLFTDEFFDKTGGLSGTRAYIVTPEPSGFERSLFEARRIEVIPISGMNMTEETASVLDEMRS
jgi:hypothetical protein